MQIVYHQNLIFGSALLNRFHPFQFDRARAAFRILREDLGSKLEWKTPDKPVTWAQLELVHDSSYLKDLQRSSTIAHIVEVPFLAFSPKALTKRWFLDPARWSVACSLLAGECALECGLGISLGGGFHHAKRQGGEGFCFLNDIAYLLESLRATGKLTLNQQVLYIDLDVHQGNGVSAYYHNDPTVRSLDVYNEDIYPVWRSDLRSTLEVPVPLRSGCTDETYLQATREGLEHLLQGAQDPALAVFNAGNDIFLEDALGGFRVSAHGVAQRDKIVLEALIERDIPTVVLASGGYSQKSSQLLAELCRIGYELTHSK